MFDTVIVEGLKLKAPKEVTSYLKANNAEFPNDFQTKDLDCSLATFRINSKGDFLYDSRKPTGKKIPYESPLAGWNDNRPVLEKLYWKFKSRKFGPASISRYVDEYKTVTVKTKITSTLTMLSYEEVGGRNLSLDYEVKVVEGKVKSVKLLSWELESVKEASERKKSDLEFKAKMDESFRKNNEFKSKWYYPVLRETINPLIFFTRIFVQAFCHLLIKWSYRWHGV